jgi:ROS/MUCR transcriptional regulator protein
LICLEDGKRFKSLRRHLAILGMTPEQYRAKWNLPSSYPMVAPNYAAQRSALAKTAGLGQWREKSIAAPPAGLETIEVVEVEVTSVAAIASEPTNDTTIESAPSEPSSVRKPKATAKAKSKTKAAEATPASTEERKRGRPRKATS